VQVLAHVVRADRQGGAVVIVVGRDARPRLLNRGVVADLFDGVADLANLERRGEVVEIQVQIGTGDRRQLAGFIEIAAAGEYIGRQSFRLGEIVVLVEAREQCGVVVCERCSGLVVIV